MAEVSFRRSRAAARGALCSRGKEATLLHAASDQRSLLHRPRRLHRREAVRRANHFAICLRGAARSRSEAAKIACTQKLISRAISIRCNEHGRRPEIFRFLFFGNHELLRASRLDERGVRAVVTIREAGMRWTCGLAVYLMHGRTSLCGREVVWSWPPGAEAALTHKRHAQRGQSSRSPGRARISVKTVAQGMPVDRQHLWYLPPAFLLQAGHGGGLHPAFPAPSLLSRGTMNRHHSGANAPRE